MAISEQEVLTLRSLLSGEHEAYQKQLDALDKHSANVGLSALISAAFVDVIDRVLPDEATDADIITFVGELRANYAVAADQLDPELMERLIRNLVGRGEVDGVDPDTKVGQELLLVGLIIRRSGMSGGNLDNFLQRARRNGDFLIEDAEKRDASR